eukprot:5319711-Prymnesium_polylepis.1
MCIRDSGCARPRLVRSSSAAFASAFRLSAQLSLLSSALWSSWNSTCRTVWPGSLGWIVARGGRPAWARRAPARAARCGRAAGPGPRASARTALRRRRSPSFCNRQGGSGRVGHTCADRRYDERGCRNIMHERLVQFFPSAVVSVVVPEMFLRNFIYITRSDSWGISPDYGDATSLSGTLPAKTVQPPCHFIFICDHIITVPPSSTGDGFNCVDRSMCVRIPHSANSPFVLPSLTFLSVRPLLHTYYRTAGSV